MGEFKGSHWRIKCKYLQQFKNKQNIAFGDGDIAQWLCPLIYLSK